MYFLFGFLISGNWKSGELQLPQTIYTSMKIIESYKMMLERKHRCQMKRQHILSYLGPRVLEDQILPQVSSRQAQSQDGCDLNNGNVDVIFYDSRRLQLQTILDNFWPLNYYKKLNDL